MSGYHLNLRGTGNPNQLWVSTQKGHEYNYQLVHPDQEFAIRRIDSDDENDNYDENDDYDGLMNNTTMLFSFDKNGKIRLNNHYNDDDDDDIDYDDDIEDSDQDGDDDDKIESVQTRKPVPVVADISNIVRAAPPNDPNQPRYFSVSVDWHGEQHNELDVFQGEIVYCESYSTTRELTTCVKLSRHPSQPTGGMFLTRTSGPLPTIFLTPLPNFNPLQT